MKLWYNQEILFIVWVWFKSDLEKMGLESSWGWNIIIIHWSLITLHHRNDRIYLNCFQKTGNMSLIFSSHNQFLNWSFVNHGGTRVMRGFLKLNIATLGEMHLYSNYETIIFLRIPTGLQISAKIWSLIRVH